MAIRQTKTNNSATGEAYFSHRLVRSQRINGKVRQVTLLNLGRLFPPKRDDGPLLCARIERLIKGVVDLLPIECSVELERVAQRIIGQLVKCAPASEVPDDAKDATPQQPEASPPAIEKPAYDSVDIDSLTLNLPRSVGIEHVALHAMKQLDFPNKLKALGVNETQCSAIIGNIMGRMAQPASELATWHWLQGQSALGELLDVDFEALFHMSLYRGSDALML